MHENQDLRDYQMKAKVFLSCGQDKKSEEATIASTIKEQLKKEFDLEAIVAIEENHWDGNSTLIEALKQCDYFLFIDFERSVSKPQEHSYFSLYSHQELAIAKAIGFDPSNMLIFHKENMKRDGMLNYTFVNSTFNNNSDVVDIVIKSVREAKWTSRYSRKLVPISCNLTPGAADWRDTYSLPRSGFESCAKQREDMSSEFRRERIATISLQNRRNDIAAINCIAHLKGIHGPKDHVDRAPLKAAGLSGYVHTIWPQETVEFDLFGYDIDKKMLFMHTECDVTEHGSRKPIISKAGTYFLSYEAYAEHFPVSPFYIKLQLGDEINGGIALSLCSQEDVSKQSSSVTVSKSARKPCRVCDSDVCGTGVLPHSECLIDNGWRQKF